MVEWEDGKLVSPAKVNEDGTITPAVYQGATPLSANNLNKMQEDLEKGITDVKNDLEKEITDVRNDLENLEKNAITVTIKDMINKVDVRNLSKVPLDTISSIVGEQLSLENNGIKIGKGISHVLVSGVVFFNDVSIIAGNTIRLQIVNETKNIPIINTQIVSPATKNAAYFSVDSGIKMIDVSEGDIITLKTQNDNNSTSNIQNIYTNLTVVAVN